jgi:hypothetical protein
VDAHQREADLDRHLEGEDGNDAIVFGSEVSAEQDYAMYQALMLLKATDVLNRSATRH